MSGTTDGTYNAYTLLIGILVSPIRFPHPFLQRSFLPLTMVDMFFPIIYVLFKSPDIY